MQNIGKILRAVLQEYRSQADGRTDYQLKIRTLPSTDVENWNVLRTGSTSVCRTCWASDIMWYDDWIIRNILLSQNMQCHAESIDQTWDKGKKPHFLLFFAQFLHIVHN